MINPVNLIKIDNLSDSNDKVFKITDLPQYDFEDYDLSDGKDFSRYLSDIENIVRGSYEYREMIKYLRDYCEMNKTGNYESIANTDSYRVKIEIHHTPFTLFDICKIVYDKRAFYHEDLSPEMVAKEVMELHYKQLVGLYPLTQTEHQLVHNQYLFVPTDKVWGRYDLFVSLYDPFIDPDLKDTLKDIEEYSRLYNEERQRQLISQSNIYIDPNGAYQLPVFDQIKDIMSNRITTIKNNYYMLPTIQEDIPQKKEQKLIEAVTFY